MKFQKAAVIFSLCLSPVANAQMGWPQQQDQMSPAIAQGLGGVLTQDNANAYFEAVDFCLIQIGEMPLQADQKQVFYQNLVTQYPMLDIETQATLANARQLLTQYQSQWQFLDLRSKQEFGVAVLGLIYGEQAAAQAVGLPMGGSLGGAGGSYGGVDVDAIGGGCVGGHCESMGDGTIEMTPND